MTRLIQKPAFFLVSILSCTLAYGQKNYFEKAKKSHNIDTAVFYGEKQLKLVTQKKDSLLIIDAICFLSGKYSIKGRYAMAQKLAEQGLSYAIVKKTPSLKGKLYLELGHINKLKESYAQALNYYIKAHTLFEKSSSWGELLRCKVGLAEYYRRLGKFKPANEYIQSAFDLYKEKKIADTSLLVRIYNRAAAIDNESGTNTKSVISKSKKALMLAQRSGDRYAAAVSMNELGFTYKNLKKNDSCEYYYKEAEKVWFSIGADREAMNAMNNRAMFYAHNNYPKSTTDKLYAEMVLIVNDKKIDYALSDAYSYFHREYTNRGDLKNALKFFSLYHNSVVDRLRSENDIEIINITEQYESEKAKKEVRRISGDLSTSREALKLKNAENKRMYFFIAILVLLIGAIAFLLVRIKKANRELQNRNREKDALIQEIHHRVKNNLQFISSLVNMQMNSSSNEAEIHSLSDASRRIKAMALVHEMLYNQKDAEGIGIKQYLEELIASLNDVVNSEKISIRFKMHLSEMNFNVSSAIALGMITSELVSNSMKHAFQGVEKPQIEITLEKTVTKEVVFRVKDNGRGMHEIITGKKTLGMRLIDIFSRQLKGKYSVKNNQGCEYEIKFALK